VTIALETIGLEKRFDGLGCYQKSFAARRHKIGDHRVGISECQLGPAQRVGRIGPSSSACYRLDP
jgi:hypothetical protein